MANSVQLFKALADRTRMRILNLLCRRELCVCQLVEILETGQSKVSRHLAHLRNAGLVSDRREGPWVHYFLAEPTGRLHHCLFDWLREADSEIPDAGADLRALASLGECSEICDEEPLTKSSLREGDVAAVGT